jgi:predicted MPP superfamily phosphohydrolase
VDFNQKSIIKEDNMQSLFFIVALTIFSLIYYYIGRRLITPLALKRTRKRILWIILALVPLQLPLSFFLRFNMNNSTLADAVGWFAFILMGFSSILLVFLFARDIYTLILNMMQKYRSKRASDTIYDPERRKFLVNSTNLAAIGVSFLVTGYGIYEARRQAKLEELLIPISGLPNEFDGFRIVQFSDVHVGPTIKRQFVESVVNQVNELNPDLIACTGDMVDGSVSDLRDDVAPLRDLVAPHGKFFVTGNHEYYVNAAPWIDEMERLGLTVLLNNHRMIEKSGARIAVAGVTDFNSSRFIAEHKSDPKAAITGVKKDIPKILLAHQPKSIHIAADAGYDLQVSGHTHGGQYIPWAYLVTIAQPYIEGLHKHKETCIYVNRGTGYWGPPMRIGVPSEVTLFTLTQA